MLTTNPFDDDKLREECGVFGIWGAEQASSVVALGLHALQHRGQEASGIVTHDGQKYFAHRGSGHVGATFSKPKVIRKLAGGAGIGHVRYSTTGETAQRNIQPLYADLAMGGFAVAHNGNISNAMTLREQLVKRGSIFQSTSDTEVIIHLVATSQKDEPVERLIDGLKQVEGAYSLCLLMPDGLVACRDPMGIRPLVMGRYGESIVFASESVAFDVIGATYLRDVEPGELIIVNDDGLRSFKPFEKQRARPCIFEHVYFSRPDSKVDGTSVYQTRKAIGEELAREAPVDADYVVPVPDSGVPAAIGYAQVSGIPFELGIIRSHYIGRTFIQPSQDSRHSGVKMKHNANSALVEGKKIVLVDDSVVRGTTSLRLVQMMRDAGAAEVHMRIASPPTRYSCFYGVDTPERSKLLAAQMGIEEMRDYVKADSLAFITIDGLYRALGDERDASAPQRCDACFSGDYPTSLTDKEKGDGPQQLSLVANH